MFLDKPPKTFNGRKVFRKIRKQNLNIFCYLLLIAFKTNSMKQKTFLGKCFKTYLLLFILCKFRTFNSLGCKLMNIKIDAGFFIEYKENNKYLYWQLKVHTTEEYFVKGKPSLLLAMTKL